MAVAIARAFRWQEKIESQQSASVQALADYEGVDEAYVRRQHNLALLQPSSLLSPLNICGTKDYIQITSKRPDQFAWLDPLSPVANPTA